MTRRPLQPTRRQALALIGRAAIAGTSLGVAWLPASCGGSGGPPPLSGDSITDSQILDAIQQAGFQFFWEQASSTTGLIKDRATMQGTDTSTLSSIASTGFGLTALCIGDSRAYQPTAQIKQRIAVTLNFLLTQAPSMNGFFYHFMDINTGARAGTSEVSSIDTAILMCGILTCRAYFQDAQITSLATQLYNRVNWQWMLNGGTTLSQGWTPESGFLSSRWDTYSELMMLYLLAIGSPTNPIPPSSWQAWARPTLTYQGLTYITGDAPLFIHQYSHAWIDFRNKRDAYANYFTNSVTATQAHKLFCLSLASQFPDYANNLWGISASDSVNGYVVWGGPPPMGPIDGTIVPSACAGSLPFLPTDTLAVLRNIYTNFQASAWTPYGFVDAFNPLTSWYDADVLGIDLGISQLMAENYRTQFVWNTFMQNPEINNAMTLAGFQSA
jgi:hypothetical protein